MSDPDDSPPAHEGPILVGEARNHQTPAGLGPLAARFVQYPGCQQLILWLPQPGHLGYRELRVIAPDGRIVEQGPLRDRLNGSVQILWDTLPWPAGEYRIEVDHVDGWHHDLALRKLPPGEVPPPAAPPAADSVAAEPAPAPSSPRYRDGLGNPIPDEDLLLRERAAVALKRRFLRRVEYEGTYRAGSVTYVDGDRRIRFWHEMATGGVMFFIDVPAADQWVGATGVPLDERDEILHFVAERVLRDQGVRRFEIGETEIRFY